MNATESDPSSIATQRSYPIRPWMIAAVAMFIVAAIAIGAWQIGNDSNDLTADQQQMVANYADQIAAMNRGDLEAIRGLFSPDAVIVLRDSAEMDVSQYIDFMSSADLTSYEWAVVDTLVTDNFIVGVTSETWEGNTQRWLTVFQVDRDTLKIVDAEFSVSGAEQSGG